MQRLLLSLTLIAALFWLSLPTAIAQEQTPPTQEDLQAAFESELTAYAATHTADEVSVYAQQRMDQMTNEALNFDGTSPSRAAVAMDGSAELSAGDIFIYPELWDYDDGSSDPRLRFCLETRNEECRQNYNAELLQSEITAIAIMAACMALSGGTAFIVCTAGALAAHALGIAAAKQHYAACLTRAKSDCYLQYGVFKP